MNGSKRTISRILAFVMLVSAMFTNVISASADVNDVSLIDSVISSAAAAVEDIIDDDAEDLAAVTDVATEPSDTDPYYLVDVDTEKPADTNPDTVNKVTYDDATGLYYVQDTDAGQKTTHFYYPLNAEANDKEIVIEGTVNPDTVASNWTLAQVYATGEDGNDYEIAAIRTVKVDKTTYYGFRANGGTAVQDTTEMTANAEVSYKFVIDPVNRKASLSINGGTALEGTYDKAPAGAGVKYVRFVTASDKARNLYVSAPEVSEGAAVEKAPETTSSAVEEPAETTSADQGGSDTPIGSFDWAPVYEADKTIASGEQICSIKGVTFEAAQILKYEQRTEADKTKDGLGDATFGGKVVTDRIKSTGVNTSLSVDGAKAANWRVMTKITAENDAKVSFATMYPGGKTLAILKIDGNQATTVKVEQPTASSFDIFEIELQAGDVVYLAGQSTNPEIYGINVTTDAAETTQTTTAVEDSTQTTTAVVEDSTQTTTAAQQGGGEGAEPEQGKTYSVNFRDQAVVDAMGGPGAKVDGYTTPDGMITIHSPEGTHHGTDHGLTLYNGDTISVKVAGNAVITVNPCCYGNGDVYNVKDATGKIIGTIKAKSDDVTGDAGSYSYTYEGDAATLTLELVTTQAEAYLHGVSVENKITPTGEAKNFELWLDDMATDVPDAADPTVVTKTVEPGAYTGQVTLTDGSSVDLADSVLELVSSRGRIGSDTAAREKFTPEIEAATNLTRGPRTGVNAYKGGVRHKTANAIPAVPHDGDPDVGTAIVFTPAADGTFNAYFYTGAVVRVWDFPADGSAPTYVDSPTGAESYGFKAMYGHTYVLSTTGSTNNTAYCGFEYFVDEAIDVTFNFTQDGKYTYDKVKVSLTDAALGENGNNKVLEYAKGEQTVTLDKDHTYILSTDDGGADAMIKGSYSFKASEPGPHTIDLTVINDVTLTGKVTGGPASAVKSIKFISQASGVEYNAAYDAEKGEYSVDLKPGDYDTVIEADGYTTMDRAHLNRDEDGVNDIYIVSYIQGFYDLPRELGRLSGSGITFENNSGTIKVNNSTSIRVSNGDKVIIPVTPGKKQKVTVAGWYAGTWDIEGQNSVTADSSSNARNPVTNSYVTDGTKDTVTVNVTADGSNYLYWVEVDDYVTWADAKKELEVPSAEFPTLKSAVKYINAIDGRPEGEEGRVTINLTKDVQEQIVFDAPYVTLKGNGNTISWYYGQTGKFYSVGTELGWDGIYDEELFQDKFSKAEPNTKEIWGGVAIVKGTAFRAEDTIFLNTFNYEVTDKEILDGAEGRGKVSGLITKETDVTAYNAKERSNAFCIMADQIECKNCQILGSQDALGLNGSTKNGYRTYFKDCVISGNTDYICGEFAAVFDNCELRWFSYPSGDSNNAKIGYITAPKTSPYVFRNCSVTATKTAGNDPVTGTWGRTWGEGSQAYVINSVTNGHILANSWGEMSGGDGATAKFYEYGNTVDGIVPFESTCAFVKTPEAADLASKASDEIINDADVYNGWKPFYYEPYAAPELPFTGWGDVDNDGDVDATDATLTHSYVLSPSNIGTNDAFYKERAEVSGNTVIDTQDVAIILQKALNSQYAMPVELEGKDAPVISDDDAPDPNKPEDSPTIWVVGDSTGCHYENTDKTYYYKRVGFGDKIKNYIYADVNNLALSGRSSSSFTEDPEYQTLTSQWAAGDYIIIAFGHNDEKAGDVRYTAPGGTKDDAGTFKNSLYVNYIKPALDKGVTPILCTPIVRRKTGANWSDNNLHKANGGDYAQDIRDLAAELGLFCIDNTQMTKDLYEQLGVGTEAQLNKEAGVMAAEATGSAALHAANQLGVADNTHINNYGAKWVAYMMAKALKDAGANSPIDQKYLPDRTEPSERDLTNSINPDWTAPSSADPSGADLDSKFWKTTAPWHGSVFGDVGGQGKLQVIDPNNPNGYLDELNSTNGVQNFVIEENSDGTVHLRDGVLPDGGISDTGGSPFGKIAGSSDGFTLYYQDVNSDNFEISGTITVNGYLIHSQTAFGAIILDTVNKADDCTSTTFPYVSAGIFRVSDIGAPKDDGTLNKGVTSFARIAGTLTYGANCRQLEQQLNVGDQIRVSIKKVGDKFTTTTQNLTAGTPAVVDTYELPMEGTIYPGFYAARCSDITISDISYTTEVVE